MRLIRRIISKLIHLSFAMIAKMGKRRGYVYMLHSIGDDVHDYNISKSSFETFLSYLRDTNVVRLEEWEKHHGFTCVTFDDVADSFYYNAFPLLKRYGIPFTIFVSCSLLDSKHYISTDMLKEISGCDLCTVGSHGWDHSLYVGLSRSEAENDLKSSKKMLEELTHRDVELYAFPYGSIYACGIRGKNLVKVFYKYGFGTINSPIPEPSPFPTYFLPRIKVDETFVEEMQR